MRAHLRGALRADARMMSQRAVVRSWALGILVVVSAAISGVTHLSGARWLVHISSSHARGNALPPRLPPTRASHGGAFPEWIVWVVIAIVVAIAVVSVAMLLWRRWPGWPFRAPTGPDPVVTAATSEIRIEPEPEPDAPAVRTGIELALQVLSEQREPADAVVRAWLGLQETAEESGIVRGPAETPTEFTSRIVSRAVTDDRAVRTLLRLYLRTRFGDHPATTDDVAAVRTALQEMVRTWSAHGAPAGARR